MKEILGHATDVIKVVGFNLAAVAASTVDQLEQWLRIVGLALAAVYTVLKIIQWFRKK